MLNLEEIFTKNDVRLKALIAFDKHLNLLSQKATQEQGSCQQEMVAFPPWDSFAQIQKQIKFMIARHDVLPVEPQCLAIYMALVFCGTDHEHIEIDLHLNDLQKRSFLSILQDLTTELIEFRLTPYAYVKRVREEYFIS